MSKDLIEKLRKGHEKQMASWGPTCKRCGAEEYRIKGFCSIYCEDMYDVEQERDQAIARAEKAEKEADDWKKSYAHALKNSDDLYVANIALIARAEKAEKEVSELRDAIVGAGFIVGVDKFGSPALGIVGIAQKGGEK